MRLIGAHVVAHETKQALHVGAAGSNAAQVFLGSPRSWTPDPSGEYAAEVPTWVHAPYICNVASDDPLTGTRSRMSLYRTIEATWRYGGRGVVVHPGSCIDLDEGLHRWMLFADALDAKGLPPVPLMLECSAGRGVAQTPEQVAHLWATCTDVTDHPFSVVVDTQHAWAAGWVPADYVQTLKAMGVQVGLLHLNGSKVEQGSYHDRHAIPSSDDDTLGMDAIARTVEVAGHDVPAIFETYAFDSVRDLRQLVTEP